MKQQVFKYLRQFSTQPNDVDRLIVSAFLIKNNIIVRKNEFLKNYIINHSENLSHFISILDKEVPKFNFEELINLFEFVISPSDRIINGAIYTPSYIRKFIIKQALNSKRHSYDTLKLADISCGCGGFLFDSAKEYKRLTNKSYFDVFKNHILGLDIQSYSVERTKLLLTLLAVSEGEDKKEFKFNLFVGDALIFNWKNELKNFNGFDIVVGNPPYVCARNLSEETKKNIMNWEVCKSGNPDLYIPFFQIGIENLSDNGILSYITMNSFFKSLNARALREYFKTNELKLSIIDFGTEQVFKSKNTYTCICLIENKKSECVYYKKTESNLLKAKDFDEINYSTLDSKKGWNLQKNEIISKIESTGVSFGSLFKTRNGIATLRNEIYIFNPVKEDKDFFYLQNGSLYQIEKGICRDIVNSNKLRSPRSLVQLREKVIFPYCDNEKPKLLDEDFIKQNYPKAYLYLNNKRTVLAKRDKGNGKYENWFAFGRTQCLEKIKHKLFFPKISDKNPNFIINADHNLLFYNGLAVIGNSKDELLIAKKIMETRLFWFYIKSTSKPYSSNYYSLSGNYINNFGICSLSKEEKIFVIKETNQTVLDSFFEKKYDIKLSDYILS